jgi:D-tyrosyl-tRNA(Tyr) deacylase
MRAVVQRVVGSKVTVREKEISSIGKGLMVLLGVEEGDSEEDVEYMAEKIMNLRIFEDQDEKMNLSLSDVKGELLVVSQFTLLGDCRKGRRPSFTKAAKPELAKNLYRSFTNACRLKGIDVEEGLFGEDMLVQIENDGPVTIIIDSKRQF